MDDIHRLILSQACLISGSFAYDEIFLQLFFLWVHDGRIQIEYLVI